MTNGIDVSVYQGFIDWSSVAQTNVSFAYAKATEGVSIIDPQFWRNWHVLAQQPSIKRGAYHFLRFSVDPVAQANAFLATANPGRGDLLPMVDVEVSDGVNDVTQRVNLLSAFVTRVEQALNGRRILIYTSYGFWKYSMNGSDAFSGHPLWIAEYNKADAPTLPPGWGDWVIWQHESNGHISGISGDVDLDRINGNADTLGKLAI